MFPEMKPAKPSSVADMSDETLEDIVVALAWVTPESMFYRLYTDACAEVKRRLEANNAV